MKRSHRPAVLVPTLALLVGACAPSPSVTTEWTDRSPHQVRFVTVAPGVQLEVLDWGGDGDDLVFLAGLSLNAHSFDDFAPRFTDTHRVIGITRRGHGASAWPDSGYSMERLVEDIRAVLDTLGIERVILAGNSMAGDEMTRFASDHPHRVAGLVYIDAAHDGTLVERLRIFEVCPSWAEVMDTWERSFENPEAFRRTQTREGAEGASVPFASETALARLAASESTPDYSAIDAPALAVYHVPRWAEDVFGGAVLSEECISAIQRYVYEGIAGFAAGTRRARIVGLADTQHLIYLATPDALEEVMRRWLAMLRAPGSADFGPSPDPARRFLTPAVDHHVHLLSPELVLDWKSLGVPFSRPDSAYTSVTAVFRGAPAKAFLVSMAHIYGSEEFRSALRITLETEHLRVRQTNDHIAGEVARDPGAFVGFCSVPLLRPYAQAEMERCRSELQLAGLKLHLPASGISLTDRSHLQILSAVAGRAAGERRPILIHLAPVEGELREDEIHSFIDHVVDPHPDLELYLAHLGGNGGFRISARRSIRAFTEYLHADAANARRKIYFELSGALLGRSTDGVPASRRSDARQLAKDLKALGLERVVFGSDYPVFDRVEFADLLHERLPFTLAELAQVMQQQAPAFERGAIDDGVSATEIQAGGNGHTER